MERVLAIAFAGALGALSRYGLQSLANEVAGRPTALGTLVINLTGAFALGLLVAATETRLELNSVTRTAVAVGFLGSYTTFSTMMLESVRHVEDGGALVAFAYLAASVVLGLALTWTGLALGRAL